MRYLSLEALSHLAISDLSREAVKKHQDIVMKALNVCSGRENGGREGEGRGREEGGLITRFFTCMCCVWEEQSYDTCVYMHSGHHETYIWDQ